MDGDESDGAREPLLAAAAPSAPDPASADGGLGGFMPEHLEYPYLDEGLLQELRSIHEHDVEAGAPGPPEELPHDDDDVFKVRVCSVCARERLCEGGGTEPPALANTGCTAARCMRNSPSCATPTTPSPRALAIPLARPRPPPQTDA